MLAPALLALAVAAGPDWVDGMPKAFPRERWVTAVGVADDAAGAEARARAGVAAFFSTAVASSSRTTETEARANGSQQVELAGVTVAARGELHAASMAVEQEVSAVTAKLLEGVEIADRWTEPTGRVHALAVLDRARAAEVLRRRVVEVDGEVTSLAARLAEPGTVFDRARIAHRLVGASARRGPLVADLRVLDPGAEPAPPAAAQGARAAAERALAAVGVAVRASGDDADRLRTAAARAVLATGMRAAAVDATPDLVVAVDEESAPPAVADGWTVVRVTARARVLDGRAETVSSFVETAKGTSGRAEEASRRAGEALAARVEERLRAELTARLAAP